MALLLAWGTSLLPFSEGRGASPVAGPPLGLL